VDNNGLLRPFTDTTPQFSTVRRRLRSADIGRTVEDERHENATESAGMRPGAGSITDVVPARNHLQGVHFGLSPPAKPGLRPAAVHQHRRCSFPAAVSAALNSCQHWHIRHEEIRKEVSP
jgi:hypothetical protein